MGKIKLGVIFGGMSTEHDVSIVSGLSIISNLNKDKYDICPIYIDTDGTWYLYKGEIYIPNVGDKLSDLEKIDNVFNIINEQDCIFPVLHGLYGEDGTIQGLFELLKKPYVGCKVLGSSICMDKAYAKIIFEKAGLNQAKYIYIKKNSNNYTYVNDSLDEENLSIDEISDIIESKIKYPMFIKPSNSGSSVGINKATNKEELKEFIKYAEKYDKKILIEEGIFGREVECAVLGNDDVIASSVGEIMASGEFYSYDSKYNDSNSKTIIGTKLPDNINDEIRRLAVKAFKAADCKGLSRVDFFVEDKTNRIIINEINTLPGFTKISMYPKLMEDSGINYSDLLDRLIELALE